MSDLHIGITNHWYKPVNTDADVVILAGDTIEGIRGILWASESFPNQMVLYIAGNHEYYSNSYPRFAEKLREAASKTSNVIFLENEFIDIDNTRFYGCTLWTDFDLFGTSVSSYTAAQDRMNDYRKIRVSSDFRKLRTRDTAAINAFSKSWLEKQIDSSYTGKKVVITHHAPSAKSLEPGWKSDELSPTYASNMETYIETFKPELWIHGHIHDHNDYMLGQTRIVSNPRGYPKEKSGFISDFVVEI